MGIGMTRIWNWLAGKIALLLEPTERDSVLGDIAENGETGWQAFRSVAGLAARRQFALWKNFRPWLAMVAVSIPAGFLMGSATRWLASGYNLYSWILWNYRDLDPSLLAESHMSLDHGIWGLARASVTLLAWSWSSGYIIGSLSHFATWLTGTVFCAFFLLAPVSYALQEQSAGAAALVVAGITLAVSFFGMRMGRRPPVPALVQAIFWGCSILTALTVYNWFWWPPLRGMHAILLVLVALFPGVLSINGLWALGRAAARRQGWIKQPPR